MRYKELKGEQFLEGLSKTHDYSIKFCLKEIMWEVVDQERN
jgi:hypothetical protein